VEIPVLGRKRHKPSKQPNLKSRHGRASCRIRRTKRAEISGHIYDLEKRLAASARAYCTLTLLSGCFRLARTLMRSRPSVPIGAPDTLRRGNFQGAVWTRYGMPPRFP